MVFPAVPNLRWRNELLLHAIKKLPQHSTIGFCRYLVCSYDFAALALSLQKITQLITKSPRQNFMRAPGRVEELTARSIMQICVRGRTVIAVSNCLSFTEACAESLARCRLMGLYARLQLNYHTLLRLPAEERITQPHPETLQIPVFYQLSEFKEFGVSQVDVSD